MLKQQAEKILEWVTAAGAEGDLIVDSGSSLSLKANQGSLEEYKVSSSQILGLRVIKDQRVGTAYSEATDEQALKELVNQALTNASFAEENPYESILDNAQQLNTDDTLLCPADRSSMDEKIALVLQLEQDLLTKDKIQSVPYNGVSDGVSQRAVYSTKGLVADSRARTSFAYAYALAAEGDKNAMAGKGQAFRDFSNIDAQQIIEETWQECLSLLDGRPVPTKRYDVIFDIDQQSSLFGVFALMLSGKAAKDGLNPWRNKVGQTVADPRLQVWDRPQLSEGFGYELFDAEGTACQDRALIAAGELQTLLHNSASARFFNTESTGHATRGPKSALGVSAHQLEICAGDAAEVDLQAGEYLYLTDLTGLHSGANAISGDFSFGASGFLCRDGERVQAVRGITVAGNFYQMLNNISCIGTQVQWNWQKSSVMAPIRFAQLAVSGA